MTSMAEIGEENDYNITAAPVNAPEKAKTPNRLCLEKFNFDETSNKHMKCVTRNQVNFLV